MTLIPKQWLRAALCSLLATGALHSAPAAAASPDEPSGPYSFCAGWIEKGGEKSSDFIRYFPGNNGWLFTSGDFNPTLSPSDSDLGALRSLVSTLAAKGVKLAIVVPPTRGLLGSASAGQLRNRFSNTQDDQIRRSYHSAIARLASTGAIVPDILTAVEDAKLPPDNHFFRSQDTHWRAEGARLTAKVVAEAVRKSVDLSAFPKKQYVTRMVGEQPYRVEVLDAVSSICGAKLPRESEPRYVTEVAEGSIGGADLLGGGQVPVVLVGTSFSRPDGAYNFSGFLSEYLGVDMLNAAIAGGGLETSMLSYLGSRDFAEAPPSVLIWEMRPFELPYVRYTQQLLATIAGACPADKALLSQSVPLQRGITPLITLDQKQRDALKGPLYLDVAAGESGLNKYTLMFKYTDFTKEDVQIDMTRAEFPPDHYFHPIPADRLKRLESVALRPAARSNATVKVSVCPDRRAS